MDDSPGRLAEMLEKRIVMEPRLRIDRVRLLIVSDKVDSSSDVSDVVPARSQSSHDLRADSAIVYKDQPRAGLHHARRRSRRSLDPLGSVEPVVQHILALLGRLSRDAGAQPAFGLEPIALPFERIS